MAYAEITRIPTQTMEHYRAVIAEMNGDGPPEGLLVQIAGQSAEDGLQIVSVWESMPHHDRFITERLHPTFQRMGHVTDPGMRVVGFEVGDLLVTAAAPA